MKQNCKKMLILIVTLLLSISFIYSTTYTVDDDGPADFATIQPAVNAATAGDTVRVYPGTYNERVILKDGVSLIGSGPDNTTINAGGVYNQTIIYTGSKSAVISGFTITGSRKTGSWSQAGIYCYRGPVIISNNVITDNEHGIVAYRSVPTIKNNTIVNNRTNGISIRPVYNVPDYTVKAVYIYSTDITSANSFKSLLAQNNVEVTLVHLDKVATTSFSGYRLIIVGAETGAGYNWGTLDAVQKVQNSGLPIIGLDDGGAALFSELGSVLGYGNCMGSTGRDVYVSDTDNALFNFFNGITLPITKIITLYNNGVHQRMLYGPNGNINTELIGSSVKYSKHFPLAKDGNNLLWGYRGAPSAMTTTGQQVFINAVKSLVVKDYTNLPAPKIVAAGSEYISGGTRKRFYFNISNWYMFPDDIFDKSPDLPPSGLNKSASRTWVRIYDQDDNYIYGFSALSKNEHLKKGLWFSAAVDAIPESFYVVLNDRRFGKTYTSAPIGPNAVPCEYTIVNNIIASNTNGIYFYNYNGEGSVLYNDVWNNSAYNYYSLSTTSAISPLPGTGEIHVDPDFIDADYHVSEFSPCIDAGNPDAFYNDPDESRSDIGAYGGPGIIAGSDSFQGSGYMFTAIGTIPTSEITTDPLSPSYGLVNVSQKMHTDYNIPKYTDSPLGGSIWLLGLFGDADDVDYYQILVAKWTGTNPPTPADYVPLSDTLTKMHYTKDEYGNELEITTSLGPKTLDGIDNVYMLTDSGHWSHRELRMIWNTRKWDNGRYTLKYKAYREDATGLTELTLTSNSLDTLTVVVDNTPVIAEIHSVAYDSGVAINECGIINLDSAYENLKFTISATHGANYLRAYKLDVLYGRDKNLGYIAYDQYVGSNDTNPPTWQGIVNTTFNSEDAHVAGTLSQWKTCAYQFRLRAWSRITNGFHYIYHDEFNDHYYLEVAPCATCK